MKVALIGTLGMLAMMASPVFAQDELPFLDALSGLSHDQCIDALEARQVSFQAMVGHSKTIGFVLESHRNECEMLRMAGEVERLSGQQARLAGEIRRLDELWAAEAAADSSLKDFEGRRRSQEIMQQTIAEMDQSISNLRSWIENSRQEARRIFRLAIDSAAEASESEISLILAASTTDAQNDVLERILGKERPKLAGLLAV